MGSVSEFFYRYYLLFTTLLYRTILNVLGYESENWRARRKKSWRSLLGPRPHCSCSHHRKSGVAELLPQPAQYHCFQSTNKRKVPNRQKPRRVENALLENGHRGDQAVLWFSPLIPLVTSDLPSPSPSLATHRCDISIWSMFRRRLGTILRM